MSELQLTSLHAEHLNLKAKMGPFAGFDMPLQYSSVKEEVKAVREACGMFDVSHMGEFFVRGKDAIKFVDHLMTNDFANAEMGKAVYSPLCRDNGTVIDDLIAYKLEEENILICVNAANIDKDWNWISSKTEGFDCQLTNSSDDYSLIAVQGPNSQEHLTALGIKAAGELSYYSLGNDQYEGAEIILARTGYTGEDGFEVFCDHQTATKVWKSLADRGVAPCGLAARDVLRLEVCYPLYGHEIHDEVTPLDSALKWTVKLDKENFISKAALSETKPVYRLVKLTLEKGIPRDGYAVENEQGETIGKVTSGTHSVTLGKGICLAHVKKDQFPENKTFFINIRERKYPAQYHAKPFVSGGHK